MTLIRISAPGPAGSATMNAGTLQANKQANRLALTAPVGHTGRRAGPTEFHCC